MNKSVIVIGGGAAGLIAAGRAASQNNSVIVLERNARPARKVMITGKGRCNVTNAGTLINDIIEQIPVNGRFLYGALTRFMPYDTMDLFESLGVKLKIERGNRVFPESDKAVDIVDALVKYARQNGAKIVTEERAVSLLTQNGKVLGVKCESGKIFNADAVIIATGGKSYPLTGSTGDGYLLAQAVGHTIVPPSPSLVPLETNEGWVKDCQGLALKNVSLTVYDKKNYKEVYSDFGEMLFTHFGVSGPIVLSASSHIRDIEKDRYELIIDLKPALNKEKLDERLIRDFAEFANKGIANALQKLLPHSLIPVIVTLSGIDPALKANKITREMRQDLGFLLKNLTLSVKGTRPIEEAIITSGGVKVNEINPKTMESKLLDGLFFAGEVIDVDAYTGGYNLQIAFATGMLAGSAV